jgi:hypothetical protein
MLELITWKVIITATTVIFASLIIDTLSRKRRSGVKPLLACFADSLLYIPQLLKIGPFKTLEMSFIISEAKRVTGLTDMGGDEKEMIKRYNPLFTEGLKRSKTVISPSGQYLAFASLQKRAENRLLMVDYIKKHPEIAKIEIRRPVFVVGFTRTGTTFLHEILGLHPEVSMHYSWEQMRSVPLTHDSSVASMNADRKARYHEASTQISTYLALAGDEIQSIHRVGIDESEECSTPCGMELPWNIATIAFMTFVSREVCKMGAGKAFPLYKQYLQVTTYNNIL